LKLAEILPEAINILALAQQAVHTGRLINFAPTVFLGKVRGAITFQSLKRVITVLSVG
jgi:hypothetical protein